MPGPFDFDQRIGTLEESESGWCLSIRNANAAAGTTVLVVGADTAELQLWPARVGPPRSEPCSTPDGGGGGFIDDPEGSAYYGIHELEPIAPGLHFVVIAPLPRFVLRDFRFQTDLDGDGKPERFESCTSFEGVHLSVISRGDTVPRWHRYYYVPYDTEPTCPGLTRQYDRSASPAIALRAF